MTKEQQAAAQAQDGDGGHEHASGEGGGLFWKIASGVLFVLLIMSGLKRKSPEPAQA